jgi:hypothetical protein
MFVSFSRVIRTGLFCSALALPLTSCGRKTSRSQQAEFFSVGVNLIRQKNQQRESFLAEANNFAGEANNFAGDAQASAFKIDVTGCDSKYTGTNLSTNPISLVKFDTNCVATLKEITFQDVIYTGSLSGAPGTKAVFTGAGKSLNVAVVSQLNSPLTTSESLTYNFSVIEQGLQVNPNKVEFEQGVNVSISGVESPNMEIANWTYVSLNAGVPTWTVQFECQSEVTPGNACLSVGGTPHDISNMDVKLVEDTFGGVLTLEQAETLFQTAGTTMTPVPAGGGDPTIPRGGMVGTFIAPGAMYEKPNYILIIRYRTAGAASYRYFNGDVPSL